MAAKNKQSAKKSRKLNIFAIGIAAIALIGACLGSVYVWEKMGQVELGVHGWVALIAGAFGTIVLGCGLMALSFYSSRSGHDEDAWTDPEKHRDLFK
jgi:heme/copper-type cytochrome/quinol oxidase subunit 2